MIQAEAHSDDHVIEVKFDATPYFEQADDEALLQLAECGWGGDYPGDYVAQHMAEKVPDVAKLFEYLTAIADVPSKKDVCGFECHVDATDAMAWIAGNRPNLHAEILADQEQD